MAGMSILGGLKRDRYRSSARDVGPFSDTTSHKWNEAVHSRQLFRLPSLCGFMARGRKYLLWLEPQLHVWHMKHL
jgi:hypothetical protein